MRTVRGTVKVYCPVISRTLLKGLKAAPVPHSDIDTHSQKKRKEKKRKLSTLLTSSSSLQVKLKMKTSRITKKME